MAEASIDRDALREIVAQLRIPSGKASDWCVACGAGAASAKLDLPEQVVNEAGRQFLQPDALRAFVEKIKDVGLEQAWCVACGAGAAASPLDKVSNPADIPDRVIDEVADKLLGAVRLGG